MTGLGRPATCSRTGACRTLRIWMRRCVLLRSVRLLPISNNTLTIRAFLLSPRSLVPPPACMASFCVFFFYRPTRRLSHTSLPLECHRKPTTRKHSGSSAAFYNGLKSKVGLAAAKAAALRVNLNVQGRGIVAPPMHAPSRTPLVLPLLLSHNLPTPRVH